MRLQLNFIERFGIMHLINNTHNASMRDWKAIDELRKVLDFTKEDVKKFNIRPADNGGILYDTEFVNEKVEFTIPDTGYAWLQGRLFQLDQQGSIHRELRPLATLIMEPEPQEPKPTKKERSKAKRKAKTKKA